MAVADIEAVPFAMPGGDSCCPSKRRPVDLVHLSRQTCGDRDLETEILSMFAHQAALIAGQMPGANSAERKRIAHTLKGSARGVGAFCVADSAAAIEANPGDRIALSKLISTVNEVREFIAAIAR